MEKKEVNITIRTTVSFKNELVQKAKELGLSLSDYGDTCLRASLMKEEDDSIQNQEIKKLRDSNQKLKEQISSRKQEVEFAKLIEANNEIHIENIQELRTLLKSREKSLKNHQEKNEKQKEKYNEALEVVFNYVQENHNSKVGLWDFSDDKTLTELLKLSMIYLQVK